MQDWHHLSHYRAIRTAFAMGHDMALVAEDDVDLSLYDESVLRNIVPRKTSETGQGNSDWSYIQLTCLRADILKDLFDLPAMGVVRTNGRILPGFGLNLYSPKGNARDS